MRKLLLAAVVSLSMSPAIAQERAVDGLLGALAGAVVAGPIGLVAGGVTGVTAGPAISSSWGLSGRTHHHHYYHRRAYRRADPNVAH
jgi:hypothetical protein